MTTKAIVLTVLIALFIILVAIDGKRKIRNKKNNEQQ